MWIPVSARGGNSRGWHDADSQTRNRAGRGLAAIAALVVLSLPAGASAAPPNWIGPVTLSQPVSDASNPEAAMDAAGGAVALWEQRITTGVGTALNATARAAGAPLGAPFALAPRGEHPMLAMTPGGVAVAAWRQLDLTLGTYVIVVATRPPGGSFSPPVTVWAAPPGEIPQGAQIAIGAGGDVVVTWLTRDPNAKFQELTCGTKEEGILEEEEPYKCSNPYFVMGSVRPAGGVFSTPERVSPPRGSGEGATQEEKEIAESQMSAAEPLGVAGPAGNVTVAWTYFDGENRVIQAATRAPGGGWTTPETISEASEPEEPAGSLDLGVDGAGNVIASWALSEGSEEPRIVQVAVKSPGGSFSTPSDVSAPGQVALSPVLGVSPDGLATVVWRASGTTASPVLSSTRPPGGGFSSPVEVTAGTDHPEYQQVAVGNGGSSIVAWSGNQGPEEVVRAAVRPAGAVAYGPPVAISNSLGGEFPTFHPKPTMDAAGDAAVVWERGDGLHRAVEMAGYDAAPPVLGTVSVPPTATVAEPLTFSAGSFDVWPAGPPVFNFGDGSAAAGGAVTHAFGAPGTYPVTVSATDSAGKTTSTVRSVLVKARNDFRIRKLKRNRRKGTATLLVWVPEPGRLTVNGRWVRKVGKRVRPGTAKIPLRATGKGLRRLRAHGKLRVRIRIAYAPVGGDRRVRHRRVTLRSKPRHSHRSRRHDRRPRQR